MTWRLKHLKKVPRKRHVGKVPWWAGSLFQGGEKTGLWEAGWPLVGMNAFEKQHKKCQSGASLYLRLSDVYRKRKTITTLAYVLHKVSDHPWLILHSAPNSNPRVCHVVDAKLTFVECMLNEWMKTTRARLLFKAACKEVIILLGRTFLYFTGRGEVKLGQW